MIKFFQNLNIQRAVFILFFVAILGAGFASLLYTQFLLKGQEDFLTQEDPLASRPERAIGRSIQLTETFNGKPKWTIHLKRIRYSQDNSSAALKGVKGELYGGEEKVLFRFIAPKGTYDKKKSKIVLNGGVKMFSPATKVAIEAPTMSWSADKDSVTATGGVKMSKQDFGISQAQKAVFAMDFSKIQFSGQAVSVIGPPSKAGD